MNWMRGLRTKFVFAVFLLLLTFFATTVILSLLRLVPRQRNHILHNAQTADELSVDNIVTTYLAFNNAVGLKLTTAMRPLADDLPYTTYFQVIEPKGTVVYDSRALKHSVVLEPVTDDRTLQALQSNQAADITVGNDHTLIYPYLDATGNHTYSVRFFTNFAELKEWSRDILWQAVILLIVFVPIAIFILSWLVQRWILEPIDHMRADSNAIAGGDLDQRLHLKTRDEFGVLGQNLNNMVQILTDRVRTLEDEKAWKNEFMTLAAHNLRSPLSVIMSASTTLKKEPNLSEQGKKFVDYISAKGKELHGLIENMLSISLLKGDKLRVAKEPFDLMTVVQKVAKEQEAHLKDKKLTLNVEAPTHQIIINGSDNQLFQVIDNVTDNAIKFTPEKGVITIHVQETAQEVAVSVQDSGPGIDPKIASKLFQSFHRGSDPLSVENRGAGLGLYFVKLAIEAHGGEVSIRSQQGKGTEISFRLPKMTT